MANRRELIRSALIFNPDFHRALGYFHTTCSVLDLSLDYAVSKFLNVPAADAHLITPGMMFGKKLKLLADLIGHNESLEKNKRSSLLAAINDLRSVRRDVITHSYIHCSDKEIKFVERITHADFRAVEHKFTLISFVEFVNEFTKKAISFHKELEATSEDLSAFAEAALSLDRKSRKSRGKPDSKG